MSKIPTAEEFLKKWQDSFLTSKPVITESLKKQFIEFTKLHVKAAIETCIEEAPSGSSTDTVSYEDVVEALKDCYPLDNIK